MRSQPLRARWKLQDLATADGHRLIATFTCSVQALASKTEIRMLEETFLGATDALTIDAVVAHFAPALQAAAAKVTLARKADDWVGQSADAVREEARKSLIDAIQKAAGAVAFSAGVEMIAPFLLDLDSPTFRQQKLEELERSLSERRTAGQVEHFERAVQLLKQFEAIRQSAPQLTPSDILDQISPADRGTMLQTLLMASARQSKPRKLWAVAGTHLVEIDPRTTPAATRVHALPASLGPLRSVQASRLNDRDVLLVGARYGVFVIDPTSPAIVKPYTDRQVESEMGFSRAVIWNATLWACHSEAGLSGWAIDQPDHPHTAYRPGQLAGLFPSAASITVPQPSWSSGNDTVVSIVSASSETRLPKIRNLAVLDDSRLIFSVGDNLATLSNAGVLTAIPADAPSTVVAILPDEQSLLVIHENGTLCVRDRQTLEIKAQKPRGIRLLAAGSLPWLGSSRLLLAGEVGTIQCIGLDDPLVTDYASVHIGPRAVKGCADLVAAVSADRQRLVVWNSWNGQKPLAEIPVSSIVKHRIADIDFA